MAAKIDEFIVQLKKYQNGEVLPFSFIVDDPSGNSFVQNPNAPTKDIYCKQIFYPRTAQDYITMGYNPDLAVSQAETDKAAYEEQKDSLSHDPKQRVAKKAKPSQTKEEQEALLEKIQAYS